MKFRRLGGSGLMVSQLGLGTNAFGKRADQATSISIVHAALDHGVNFIDTANIYAGTESERIIGIALQGRRHEAVLATKAGLPRHDGPNGSGASRHHLMRELDNSLRRLRTSYIDLYQIHTFDPNTPLEETLRTLDDMVSSGKVRYIGASNYAAWELMKAIGISERRGYLSYVSIQSSYSLADRTPEREIIPLCLDQKVGLIPYFPLAGGILTGKYSSGGVPPGSRADSDPPFARFLTGERIALANEVRQLALAAGTTPGALSLAWLMSRPAVSTVIAGATHPSQLEDSLGSLCLKLDEAILKRLDELSEPFVHSSPFAVYRLPV
ncbi:aldo/keto reductase [Paenibacillus spiritus]|uniref:Aldo/keto reductase n=1 Tax=Paenibacillus spiritus TaxID=2496557 RepID=A0A5J5GCC1_9BACL|nr:aldo/keto reductase [Paenibacillus spiritus]KAA9005805.1 aldo/keto reductase [Paenibacillus spiritus]